MPHSRLSACQQYHEFTKYSPEGLAQSAHTLDWEQEPTPFKEYPEGVGTSLSLKPYLNRNPQLTAELEAIEAGLSEEEILQRQRLSQFLYFSYGVTLVVPTQGRPLHLRSSPSAGGLYPAELYLISRGTLGIPAGLYNYQARTHSVLRFWDDPRWERLTQACLSSPWLKLTSLALVTTVVFFRSAWRYQDRAYRRVCLDTGHLLGNVELAANLTGFQACLIGGFYDQWIEELLFLEESEESPLAVIPLVDTWLASQSADSDSDPEEIATNPTQTALPSSTVVEVPQLRTGDWLPFLHQATRIGPTETLPESEFTGSYQAGNKYDFPFCSKTSTHTDPLPWGEHLQQLVQTVLKRRSTRRFSGEPLALADLLMLLDFTYHPEHYREQGLDADPDYFDLSLIETFVVATGVTGLEAGCYYYAPLVEELRQIRFKNFRADVYYLCLNQALGRDAGAIVFHTADLQQAVAKYGERAYRYLHMDAGHLGQRLNLAAIRAGLGVSGIAGFFDDQVNQVLGIPDTEAVLYITTLGSRPVRDS